MKGGALSLFDVAAEQNALRSGRPKSQERAEFVPISTAGAGFRCLNDHPMRYHKRRGLYCPECDR